MNLRKDSRSLSLISGKTWFAQLSPVQFETPAVSREPFRKFAPTWSTFHSKNSPSTWKRPENSTSGGISSYSKATSELDRNNTRSEAHRPASADRHSSNYELL